MIRDAVDRQLGFGERKQGRQLDQIPSIAGSLRMQHGGIRQIRSMVTGRSPKAQQKSVRSQRYRTGPSRDQHPIKECI